MLQEKSTGLRGYPILGSRSYVSCSANYSFTIIFSIRVIYYATLRLAAQKNSFTLYGLTSGMVQGGIWTPVYRHTLAIHGNSEWIAFMWLTRTGP